MNSNKSQIAIYMVLGLVILLVLMGSLNLALQLVPTGKTISTKDVNVFINSCLDISSNCALYHAGLNANEQSLNDIKTNAQDYIKSSLGICFGDLSQKFKGDKFKMLNATPDLLFADELTSVNVQKLGDLTNGQSKTSLEGYAARLQIAFAKIYNLSQQMPKPNSQKESKIDAVDPRFQINVYQLNEEKEAVVITDALSRINGKDYKAVFVN